MGRHPFGLKRKYEIKRLTPRHMEILRRLAEGQSYQRISLELGITTQTISNVYNSAIAKPVIEQLQREMDDAFIKSELSRLLPPIIQE